MSNQEQSLTPEGLSGSTFPIELMFEEWRKVNQIPLDHSRIDSLKLTFYSACLILYNTWLYTMRKDPSLFALAALTKHIKTDLDGYFTDQNGVFPV